MVSRNRLRSNVAIVVLVLSIATACRSTPPALPSEPAQSLAASTPEPARPTTTPTAAPAPSATPMVEATATAQPTPAPDRTDLDTGTDVGLVTPPGELLDTDDQPAEQVGDLAVDVDPPQDPPGDQGEVDKPAPPTEPLATFDVIGTELTAVGGAAIDPAVQADADRIWQRFAQLVPDEQREDVAVLAVWDQLEGGGYVRRTVDTTGWELHVTTALQGTFLDYLLLHEFGHIYTLRVEEAVVIDDAEREQFCVDWFSGDGCLLEDSLLDRFYERFWTEGMLEQASRASTETDTSLFLVDYPAVFVSRYASTNPVEDFAETWVSFLTRPEPQADGTLATEKLQFLWRRDALVELRSQIVSGLALPPR